MSQAAVHLSKKKVVISLSIIALTVFLVFLVSFQDCAICNLGRQDPTNETTNGAVQRNDLSVEEAYQLIYAQNTIDPSLILDVRTQSEYHSGHIENATLVPYDAIEANIDFLMPYQNQSILVYCRSGSRSAIASATLLAYNFTQVNNMLGGFSAWVDAGYPYTL